MLRFTHTKEYQFDFIKTDVRYKWHYYSKSPILAPFDFKQSWMTTCECSGERTPTV